MQGRGGEVENAESRMPCRAEFKKVQRRLESQRLAYTVSPESPRGLPLVHITAKVDNIVRVRKLFGVMPNICAGAVSCSQGLLEFGRDHGGARVRPFQRR